MLDQLISYLYIPYQFLQVIGYRLVGKRCDYRWGQYGVKPVEPVTRKQHLVGGLFPVAIFWMIVLFQGLLYVYLYYLYHTSIIWIPLLFGLLSSLALGSYFYLVIFDVLRLRRLFRSDHYSDSEIKESPQN